MPDKKQQKIYFIYFILSSIVILIVFAFIILGSFWDYWSQNKQIENYYKNRLLQLVQKSPQINTYDPIKGGALAKVTIIEYSDFTCSSCKNFQSDLAALEKFYGNQIKIVFKGYPITINPENRPSLNAAYCASEQGKFWEFKDLLFANNLNLNKQKYIELANSLGLDMSAYNECLDTNKFSPVIDQNLSEGLELQITSVPTVYVNNQQVKGIVNYNNIKKLIDQEMIK